VRARGGAHLQGRLRIDLLAALGTSAVHVAKSATATCTPTIPIVFAMGSDPVAEGFVESL